MFIHSRKKLTDTLTIFSYTYNIKYNKIYFSPMVDTPIRLHHRFDHRTCVMRVSPVVVLSLSLSIHSLSSLDSAWTTRSRLETKEIDSSDNSTSLENRNSVDLFNRVSIIFSKLYDDFHSRLRSNESGDDRWAGSRCKICQFEDRCVSRARDCISLVHVPAFVAFHPTSYIVITGLDLEAWKEIWRWGMHLWLLCAHADSSCMSKRRQVDLAP